MGYEVIFYFHERREDGKYNTEEKKELKKKVGTPLDEIPMEQLAATIMAQLARRDIWVVDVDIFEFTKKKISFKESTDGSGVVIKGKKFSLDKATANMVVTEEEAPQPAPVVQSPVVAAAPQMVQPKQVGGPRNLAPLPPIDPKRVSFWATFEPEQHQLEEVRRAGIKCTPGKRYPVHRERSNPNGGMLGSLWTISDDNRKVLEVDEKYFVRVGVGLIGDDEVGFSQPRQEGPRPRLSFEGELRADPNVVLLREAEKVQQRKENLKNIPVADGGIPADLYAMPDLRKNGRG